MNPIALVLVTFGLWIAVKGEASAYWALATTPNASKGGSASPSPTAASSPSAGSLIQLPALPSLSSGSNPNVFPLSNLTGYLNANP